MDFIRDDDKNYWEQVLIKTNRRGGNSARRYKSENEPLAVYSQSDILKRKSETLKGYNSHGQQLKRGVTGTW